MRNLIPFGPLAFALAIVLATDARAAEPCADPVVIADMRTQTLLVQPSVDAVQKTRIATDVFEGRTTFTINSVAHGSFTAVGRDQMLYLAQQGAPDATSAQAQDAVIVIYEGAHLVRKLPTTAGNFVEAAKKIDSAAPDSLLVRADHYQMATASTRLTLLRLDGEKPQVQAVFDDVLVDRCEDERFGGDVEAAVASHCADGKTREGMFWITRYEARCVDGKPPRAADFAPLKDVERRISRVVQG